MRSKIFGMKLTLNALRRDFGGSSTNCVPIGVGYIKIEMKWVKTVAVEIRNFASWKSDSPFQISVEVALHLGAYLDSVAVGFVQAQPKPAHHKWCMPSLLQHVSYGNEGQQYCDARMKQHIPPVDTGQWLENAKSLLENRSICQARCRSWCCH